MDFCEAAITIGVAVYYGIQGEKLTDGPVDIWLDRCWWGRHEGLKQLKPRMVSIFQDMSVLKVN
jgi:hypothetical protein